MFIGSKVFSPFTRRPRGEFWETARPYSITDFICGSVGCKNFLIESKPGSIATRRCATRFEATYIGCIFAVWQSAWESNQREAHDLFFQIHEARELREFGKLKEQMKTADLLIIDDLFLRKLPLKAANELQEILLNRYEKASTLMTSNRLIED